MSLITPNAGEEVRADLSPILDVFGGADGGVAYVKLQHHFLTAIYAKPDPSPLEIDLMVMVKKFSKLCEFMLEGK